MRQDRLGDPPSLLCSEYRHSFVGVNWPGREVKRSPSSTVEVKKSGAARLLPCTNKFTFTQIYNRGYLTGAPPTHTHTQTRVHNTQTQMHTQQALTHKNTQTHAHKNLLQYNLER